MPPKTLQKRLSSAPCHEAAQKELHTQLCRRELVMPIYPPSTVERSGNIDGGCSSRGCLCRDRRNDADGCMGDSVKFLRLTSHSIT
jgi:hypothetical protein